MTSFPFSNFFFIIKNDEKLTFSFDVVGFGVGTRTIGFVDSLELRVSLECIGVHSAEIFFVGDNGFTNWFSDLLTISNEGLGDVWALFKAFFSPSLVFAFSH